MKTTALSIAALACLCSLASCQNYKFEAQSKENFTIPAAGVADIGCKTHNGRVEIIGKAGATSIEVAVTKTVRATTQAIADAALAEVTILREREDDRFDLSYSTPKVRDGWNGHASFTVTCPIGMLVRANTHNGGIKLSGVGPKVQAETHNGAISVKGACEEVDVESHNGAIRVQLDGNGTVAGSVTTHNGGVHLTLGSKSQAKITARTHNGGMGADAGFHTVNTSKRGMTAMIGEDPQSTIAVSTHNGAIRLSTQAQATEASTSAPGRDVKDG